MCVKEETESYKLVLNILYMTIFVMPSISVLEVAAWVKQAYTVKA